MLVILEGTALLCGLMIRLWVLWMLDSVMVVIGIVEVVCWNLTYHGVATSQAIDSN